MIPKHVCIIMDGNGRWAKLRDLPRIRGHYEGAKRVDDIVTACRERGVENLTLYAFSTENWARPAGEVRLLMRLLVQQLKTMDKKLLKNNVRLTTQGRIQDLPLFVQKELKRVCQSTLRTDSKMRLNLCLSYGGRQEIADATKKIAQKVSEGKLTLSKIDEKTVAEHLYCPDLPDPDLLIRTGGEYRVSNFLLWEIAYTELYTTQALWPDFRAKELDEAFREFSRRERRFGKTSDQISDMPALSP